VDLVDVSERLGEGKLSELFALSVGYPTPEKLAGLAARYSSESSWSAFALFEGANPVGVIGIELPSPGSARIQHISVSPGAQRSGIGRHLIEGIRTRNALRELYAETDAGSVPFYRRCGFFVTSLGELYPGIERFSCWWRDA